MRNIPIAGKSNPFAKFFRFGRITDTNVQDDREKTTNSIGLSQEQIDFGYNLDMSYNSQNGSFGDYAGGLSSMSIQFDQYFREKSQRIFKYREMSYYPNIANAIDMISDEAMVDDNNGDYITLHFKEELPSHIEEQLRDMWDYLINDVFSLRETGWELFRRWLIDGELFLELILSDDAKFIIDYKVLPPHTMTPIYDDSSEISGFIQTPTNMYSTNNTPTDDKIPSNYGGATDGDNTMMHSQETRFDRDQVLYVDSGNSGRNKLDVRGFLDGSIRLYNQLKYLEDAVVVYRIVRAPERRIWNVGVGRMNKGKAEQYIGGMIQRYRKNVHYDPTTGAMDSSRNFQAMTEDFWFAKDENGYGTDVTTLAGGQNLGELEDVYFFEGKLNESLKIPPNRWHRKADDTAGVYTTGKGGEITREEIQFSRFINRLQKKFSSILSDAYLTTMRLQGFDDKYIDPKIFRIEFTQSNLWKQYKELEILESRFGILGAIETYIYKPEENDNGPFSMEFILRNWFMMSDVEYEKNKVLLLKEKEAFRLSAQSVGFNNGGNTGAGAEGDAFGGDTGVGAEGDAFGGDMGAEAGVADAFGIPTDGGMGMGDETGAEDIGAGAEDTGEFDT